ncbi:unnamed protein product [Lepeophtheirus salmonis]|uniref:(salmon louse) hypothetical protein n=1 Tax=Lepeophtheirus salmonis TaxID=72036 RepID=A0A7R8CRJ8_LEPSM|nr:unnamed protein product [Lepeophtheirus salmonis]CAF2905907.1 unnamed protein product [Lepeophtheirus salmonis]
MKLYPISLLLLSHFIVSGFTDLSDRNYCPPNLFRFWPQKENQPYNDSLDYNFIPNDNAQRTGPIYKLEVVSPTINLFEPGIGYRMTLSTTEEVSLIHKFLISIVHNDSFKTPGKLKSLSDKSEPISYNSPESGCVDISAQVMDSGDSLFQFDNDPHRALKKTLCVRKKQSYLFITHTEIAKSIQIQCQREALLLSKRENDLTHVFYLETLKLFIRHIPNMALALNHVLLLTPNLFVNTVDVPRQYLIHFSFEFVNGFIITNFPISIPLSRYLNLPGSAYEDAWGPKIPEGLISSFSQAPF